MFGSPIAADFEPIQVKIPSTVLRQLELYIHHSESEISGLGEVEVESAGRVLRVRAVHLFKQVSSFAVTDLDAEAQGKFMSDRIEAGEPVEDFKLWWHSHYNMEVFWSDTDEAAIREKSHAGWWLSIVGNQDGEYLVRVDIFPTLDMPLRLTLPAEIVEVKEYDDDQAEQIRREIDKKVKPPKSSSEKGGKKGGKRRSEQITALDRLGPPYPGLGLVDRSSEPVRR